MRRAAAVLLALALAACGVDLEGAPCATPGQRENCPAGQGCGADLRCSVKALDCVACLPGARDCDAGDVKTCVADGACSAWSLAACPAPQTCRKDTAAGASCACSSDPVECHGVAGDNCDASGQLVSCAADAQGCLHVVEQRACPDHEACDGSAGAAACACLPTPAECALTGTSCSDASTVTTCSTTADGCTFLVGKEACLGHQECTAGVGSASCGCIPAPDCAAASAAGQGCALDGRSVVTCDVDGACPFVSRSDPCLPTETCSASGGTPQCRCNPAPTACEGHTGTFCTGARDAVVTCPTDGHGCVTGASTAECGAGSVCGDDGATCRPRYLVTLLSPTDGALVGASGVTITAKVTLGTADAGVVPVPARLTLVVDGQAVSATLAQTSRTALDVSYSGTWLPPSNENGRVTLAAQVDGAPPSPAIAITADAIAPQIAADAAACAATPCARDGVLTVKADVRDARLSTVQVALDLADGPATIPLTAGDPLTPTLYSASVPLASFAFPWFSRTTHVTITATDAAGNAAVKQHDVDISRLRWKYGAGAAVTSPAVAPDGNLLVGVASTTNQLRAISPAGSELWKRTLGSKGVHAAPTVGTTALWVAADDGRLYAEALDATALLTTCSAVTTSASATTPALRTTPEAAFIGTSNGQMVYASATGGPCNNVSTNVSVTSTPIVVNRGAAAFVIAATASGGTTPVGTAYRFHDSTAAPGVLVKDWNASIGLPVIAPLAALATGDVLAASENGTIYRLDATSQTANSRAVAAIAGVAQESIVVDGATGDLIFGADDNRLHRIAVLTGIDAWEGSPQLSATPAGVALATKDASGAFVLVTFVDGSVAAFKEGTAGPEMVWQAAGDGALASAPLSFPVVAPPPAGAPSTQLPTLYAGSQDGNLYAVVVDSPLDTASPWPKSHHDLRNSGNASWPSVLW